MKWLSFLGIVAVVTMMTGFEWPKINGKPEKWAFAALTGIGALLAMAIIAFPGLPNPDQIVEWIYRPITSLMGQ